MFRPFLVIITDFHICALLSYIVMLVRWSDQTSALTTSKRDCVCSHKYTLILNAATNIH